MSRPKILVTGANGQVGAELAAQMRPLGDVTAVDRATLDLADPDALVAAVRALKPDLIVNAAAYTAVDRAETERDLAYAVNATAPGILAAEVQTPSDTTFRDRCLGDSTWSDRESGRRTPEGRDS